MNAIICELMDPTSSYSPFIEHSFRRLTLLIHQQDALDTTASSSLNKTTEQSFDTPLLINNEKNNNELVSLSLKTQPHRHSANEKTVNSIETSREVEPMLRANRTYMRPPKNRTSVSSRSSSSLQFSNRFETFLNRSSNSPCSLSSTQQKSNDLPIHVPYQRTLYDLKCEMDRQNDARQKHNIPSPFQRKWLRQPRYIPQERPNFGQIKQSQQQ